MSASRAGEIPAIVRKTWLKHQATATLIELHALFCDASREDPTRMKNDKRWKLLQQELTDRGHFG